jgi:Protein of unknown function (DUF3224)
VAMTARGTFDVTMTPRPTDDVGGGPTVGRMTIEKRFHGDLEGISRGQMLAVRTEVEGSAGYVAMELVTGTVGGRAGTFVLQHSGAMTRGARELSVTVVPDSGTGDLTGLSGRMQIIVDGPAHSYELDYRLGAS